MTLHIKYNNYVPDVEDLKAFDMDINTLNDEDYIEFKQITNTIINKIDKNINSDFNTDNLHIIYAKWTVNSSDIDKKTSAYSFHPEHQDWSEQPSIYIKSSTEFDDWREEFKENMLNSILMQLVYQNIIEETDELQKQISI